MTPDARREMRLEMDAAISQYAYLHIVVRGPRCFCAATGGYANTTEYAVYWGETDREDPIDGVHLSYHTTTVIDFDAIVAWQGSDSPWTPPPHLTLMGLD